MYVSSATGLQVYDVSAAATPRHIAQLPLPHFENEDVDVGRDTVVITNDPSFSTVGAIYLIDVADPANPVLRSVLPTSQETGNGHIANCIQGCDYLYTTGTAEGLAVYDIRDLDAPKFVKTIPLPGEGFTHDVHIDAAGIAWVTGEDGTFGFDVTDPLNPVLQYRSDPSIVNTGGGLPGQDGSGPLDFLHHNMLRTSLMMDDAGEVTKAETPGTGNVLVITEEDYAKPTCEGQGSVQTWRITDDVEPGRHGQARAARHVDHRAQRAGQPDRPLAGDRQLLGALVRRERRADRAGLVRPGRPVPRRHEPARDQAGRLLRDDGDVLGGVLRSGRPRDGLRARHDVGRSTCCRLDRSSSAQARRMPVTAADLLRGTRKLTPSSRWGFACPLPI